MFAALRRMDYATPKPSASAGLDAEHEFFRREAPAG